MNGSRGRRRLADLADLAIAVGFLVLMQVEVWVLSTGVPASTRLLASVITPIAGGALAVRRRRPMGAFLATFLAVGTLILVGFRGNVYQFTTLVTLYTVAAHEPRRRAQAALGLNLAGIGIFFLRFPAADSLFEVPFTMLLWTLAWAAGRAAAARSREQELAAERDLAAEVAATRQARLELEEERSRMARELHDLIGHTLNVMVVYAGAGRRAIDTDPADARAALATIEETGRTALEELDRLLGILRREDDERLRPLPGVEALAPLVERFSSAGLPTELEVRLAEPLPRPLSVLVYRIVQEALTNTLKHAGAATARVTVAQGDGVVTVEVVDDGRGGAGQPGRGLRGMAERAHVHGGTVEHGPRPEGGFRVTARLPTEGTAT